MKKTKDELDSKATFLVEKGKQQLEDGKKNKAMRNFVDAADLFEEIAVNFGDNAAWKLVTENLVLTAKLLLDDQQYMSAARIQKRLGNVALIVKDYTSAGDYYNVAAKYALKDEKPDPVVILHVSAIYCFITYLQAEHEKSRDFLKKILGMFDSSKVSGTHVYSILKDFFNVSLDKKMPKISIKEQDLEKEGFTREEIWIIKVAISIRAMLDDSSFSFAIDKPTKEPGHVAGEDITSRLDMKLVGDAFLRSMTTSVQAKTIIVEKSNDLTVVEDFAVPATIKLGDGIVLKETFKSYHAGNNEVGPLFVDLVVGDFLAKKRIEGSKFMIHGRPVVMVITIEKLQEPLVGKPFPLRIEILNESRGDASNLEVEVKLPTEPELQLVRGTLTKKFYALRGGEQGSWELQVVPIAEGQYPLMVILNYKDANGKQAEPVVKEEMIEVKM
nr:hypothetical protein [Candidatus Sigynarchaeota archaeon]